MSPNRKNKGKDWADQNNFEFNSDSLLILFIHVPGSFSVWNRSFVERWFLLCSFFCICGVGSTHFSPGSTRSEWGLVFTEKYFSRIGSKYENGIVFNDESLNIMWPKKIMLVSKKDKNLDSFKNFCKNIGGL